MTGFSGRKGKTIEAADRQAESERKSGRTTEQIRNAPKEALFIWCNDHITYPSELARKLKRTDLRIMPLIALTDRSRTSGLQYAAVILDHAARDRMTAEHYNGYRWLQTGARSAVETNP